MQYRELPEHFVAACEADVENGLYTSVEAAMNGRSQDGDFELCRSLSNEEFARLVRPTEIGFIYFLLFHGCVVYVGKSEGAFINRVHHHRRMGWQFSSVRVLQCGVTGYPLLQEEQRFIRMFKPGYNKSVWT